MIDGETFCKAAKISYVRKQLFKAELKPRACSSTISKYYDTHIIVVTILQHQLH